MSVLYAVGIVELELESTSAFLLLLFVVPLAFTLSGFLLWILYSLNGKIICHMCMSRVLTVVCSNNYPTRCSQATLQAPHVQMALQDPTHDGCDDHHFLRCILDDFLRTSCRRYVIALYLGWAQLQQRLSQITAQSLGKSSGGYWMAGWLCSISSTS